MTDWFVILAGAAVMAALLAVPLMMLWRTRRLGVPPCDPASPPGYEENIAARAAESLSAAIGYQTVSRQRQGRGSGYGEWARLRDYLRTRYPLSHQAMKWEVISGYSLLCHWASPDAGQEPILLCAHMDVVPAENQGWSHLPFAGDVEDGFVWGRGALDCKNVMIAIMEACESLLEDGYQPARDIYIAFGHDEESGGADGAGGIAEVLAARGLRFAMVLDEGGALCRSAVPAGRPVAHIGVAEKGMANLRFTASGGGGHASAPPRRTGLGRLAEVVCRLEFRPPPPRLTPLVRDSLIALSPELSWRWRFYLANLWLFRRRLLRLLSARPDSAALIRTTVAPTMARGSTVPNVLPDNAEIVMNMRLLHGENEAALTQYLTDLTADLQVDVEVLSTAAPSKVSLYEGRTFEMLVSSIRRTFGPVPVVPALMCGGTDARYYENLSDCVYRFMPFVLPPEEHNRIHGRDERVSVEAMGRAVAFYQNVLTENVDR